MEYQGQVISQAQIATAQQYEVRAGVPPELRDAQPQINEGWAVTSILLCFILIAIVSIPTIPEEDESF